MKYIKEYNEYVDPFNEEDWGEVEPDGKFLTWLKINHPDEIKWKDIKEINCGNQNLTDLIGIDKLIKLEILNCYDNRLTELDVSKNINLEYLDCRYNVLSQLYVNKNIKLVDLFCSNNELKELDISKNINLKYLHYNNNYLNELDLSKNIKLRYVKK